MEKSFSHSHCFSQTSVLFWEVKRKWATLCITQTWSQKYKQVWKGFSNLDKNKKEWILLLSVPKTRRRRQWEMFIGVPPLSVGPGGKGNRNQQEGLRDVSISSPPPRCERGDRKWGWEPLLDFPGLWNICLGKAVILRVGCWEQYGEQKTESSPEISSEISSVPQWKRVKGEVNLHPCFRKYASSPWKSV